MDRKEELESLFDETVTQLRQRIANGEAKPADIANAIKLLQNNGIRFIPEPGNPLQGLIDDLQELPFHKGN